MRAETLWLAPVAALSALAGCGGRTVMEVESIVCPSGQSACYGTCINEQIDNHNCGGCGAVCSAALPSTAICTVGRCLVTLAAGEDFADFAVGATGVYWTTYGDNTVRTVAIGGGTPTTLASGQDTPSGIAVDTTSVYWTNYDLNGTVRKVAIRGGTPTTLASGQTFPENVAVHGTSVYWANWTHYGLQGTVMTVPVGGGTPMTLASGQDHPGAINVTATSVYWGTSLRLRAHVRTMVVQLVPRHLKMRSLR